MLHRHAVARCCRGNMCLDAACRGSNVRRATDSHLVSFNPPRPLKDRCMPCKLRDLTSPCLKRPKLGKPFLSIKLHHVNASHERKAISGCGVVTLWLFVQVLSSQLQPGVLGRGTWCWTAGILLQARCNGNGQTRSKRKAMAMCAASSCIAAAAAGSSGQAGNVARMRQPVVAHGDEPQLSCSGHWPLSHVVS